MKKVILSVLAVGMMTATTPAHARNLKMSAYGETEAEACNSAGERVESRYQDRWTRVTSMGECQCSPRRNVAGNIHGYVCEVAFSYERRD